MIDKASWDPEQFKNGILIDYINAWNGHAQAFGSIAEYERRGIPTTLTMLEIVSKPILNYQEYIEDRYDSELGGIIIDASDSFKVDTINEFVQQYNRELEEGYEDASTFEWYYAYIARVVFDTS
tara:strand:+ start:2459 stop:2830 length:372 start_codon:yes stop_codon:yes gene_type:complete